MLAPLTEEWIEEQLSICDGATRGPWQEGVSPLTAAVIDGEGRFVAQDILPGNAIFIAAAHEGYPLVLRELLEWRKQRCETCHFFEYEDLQDEWVCRLRITDNTPNWYCGDWKRREKAE